MLLLLLGGCRPLAPANSGSPQRQHAIPREFDPRHIPVPESNTAGVSAHTHHISTPVFPCLPGTTDDARKQSKNTGTRTKTCSQCPLAPSAPSARPSYTAGMPRASQQGKRKPLQARSSSRSGRIRPRDCGLSKPQTLRRGAVQEGRSIFETCMLTPR